MKKEKISSIYKDNNSPFPKIIKKTLIKDNLMFLLTKIKKD
jgi:hypothetical protein